MRQDKNFKKISRAIFKDLDRFKQRESQARYFVLSISLTTPDALCFVRQQRLQVCKISLRNSINIMFLNFLILNNLLAHHLILPSFSVSIFFCVVKGIEKKKIIKHVKAQTITISIRKKEL